MKNAYGKVIEACILSGARVATKYLSPKEIVRVSRRTFKNKFDKYSIELVVTIGKPNFAEREFIKKCIKVGEKFPLNKIQFKFLSANKK